jgi:hypothetical protein
MLDKKIVLSRDITGCLNDFALFEDGKIRTCHNFDTEDIVYGSKEFKQGSFLDIAGSIGMNVDGFVDDGLISSYAQIYGQDVNWMRALGKNRFVSTVNSKLREISKEIQEKDHKNYLKTLIKGRKVLGTFRGAQVDHTALSEELKKRESSNLNSLIPDKNGTCETVRYSHSSQTGRMTVTKGPKVLLLSKEDRRFFIPSKSDSVLTQIDFVSLEPRVAYLLTHDGAPRDIYTRMGEEVGGDVSRAKLKIATISSLYGSSKADPAISKKISRFFSIDKLTERYLNNERLFNLYGRPLFPEDERLRLSHFVQSTAVDVALLGFSIFCESRDITPYFMIHDSLVFECTRETYDSLSKEDLYVDVEPIGRFYLGLSPFNEHS